MFETYVPTFPHKTSSRCLNTIATISVQISMQRLISRTPNVIIKFLPHIINALTNCNSCFSFVISHNKKALAAAYNQIPFVNIISIHLTLGVSALNTHWRATFPKLHFALLELKINMGKIGIAVKKVADNFATCNAYIYCIQWRATA